MSELTNFDAVDQAGLVASGKVSARELVDAAIAQAEAVNGDINAIIHPRFERAQKEADAGLPAGPAGQCQWPGCRTVVAARPVSLATAVVRPGAAVA